MSEDVPQIPKPLLRTKRKLLVLDDETLGKIAAVAQLQCTQKEAAAVLQVGASTFELFLQTHPEAKEAWYDGRKRGRASLRRLLWTQAQTDAAQARFLAKDTRWLQMDEGRDRISDAATINITNNTLNMQPDERRKRVEELQMKVINALPKPSGD